MCLEQQESPAPLGPLDCLVQRVSKEHGVGGDKRDIAEKWEDQEEKVTKARKGRLDQRVLLA